MTIDSSDQENIESYASALELEKKFQTQVQVLEQELITQALVCVLKSRKSAPLAKQATEIYRASTLTQKVETLNAIVSSVGIDDFLAMENTAVSGYLTNPSRKFDETSASQVIPVQVGEIVQALAPDHPLLIEALCHIYSKSTVLMNELGHDTLFLLTKKLEKLMPGPAST